MTLAFLYLLNIVLLTRLPLLLRDKPVQRRQAGWATAVQLLALLALAPSYSVGLLAVAISGMNYIAWRGESREHGSVVTRRLIMLATHWLVLGVLCSGEVRFHPGLDAFQVTMANVFVPAQMLAAISWKHFHAGLLGVLLSLNEANLLVRYVIENFVRRPGEPGKAEYDRGRLIGLLERLLFFFFVLQGQYSTLGFVLAAKGIARFKELENRDFAEYFLIGTMLSIVTAGAVALLVKAVLLD